MTKKLLNKASILSTQDRIFEDIEVPEWGGFVRVRSLTAAEKDAFEASLTITKQVGRKIIQQPNLVNVRAKLAAQCIVDENGQRLFSDLDVLELGGKSAAALDRIVEAAKRLSRLDDDDLEKLTAELKNDQPVASPIA